MERFKSLLNKTREAQRDPEFARSMISLNIVRIKLSAAVILLMEFFLIIITAIGRAQNTTRTQWLIHWPFLLLLAVVMVAYWVVFSRFEREAIRCQKTVNRLTLLFVCFVLAWCAGISLMDQRHSGQIFVYIVAIVCVAITPLLPPHRLLAVYLVVHIIFYLQRVLFCSGQYFGDVVNSTIVLVIVWVIAFMRYLTYYDNSQRQSLLKKKSQELEKANASLEKINRRLEQVAQTDSMTGALNRRGFNNAAREGCDRCARLKSPLTLMMVDIDCFKEYNDHHGHLKGDDCIITVLGVLVSCVESHGGVTARFGGDEFVVLLEGTDKETIDQIARNIRTKVEELHIPHQFSPVSEWVTVSLGIHTAVPEPNTLVRQLLEVADRALYSAKANRNCIVHMT